MIASIQTFGSRGSTREIEFNSMYEITQNVKTVIIKGNVLQIKVSLHGNFEKWNFRKGQRVTLNVNDDYKCNGTIFESRKYCIAIIATETIKNIKEICNVKRY